MTMRAVSVNQPATYPDALALEKSGALKNAAVLYKQLHRAAPQNLKILHRLMLVYRKLKDPASEIQYINAAIKVLQQHYTSTRPASKKVATISKKLNLLLGHTDKKGKPVLKPDALLKLELRKGRLLQKKK